MCAIIGFNFPDRDLILKMRQFVSNRGPDAEGIYIDENMTIFHNRLSIIDLDTGHQPISSSDNRFHLVCNGEIYIWYSFF